MTLKPGEVKTIAHLARIGLEESEVEPLAKELSTVLDLVAKLAAIDTSHVEPMAHPANTELRLRDDVVTESDQRDVLQAPAPAIEDGYFLVPRVIE
ncbi:MAG: Asp-tRNA(Asn)/Glu-tRNA(Gln) amidotransferase subunit GatC [Granulosicoccus sp.]